MKKTIEVTILPVDAEGSFLSNFDCSMARALKKVFPGAHINAVTSGARIGDVLYDIKSVKRFDENGEEYDLEANPVDSDIFDSAKNWLYDDHNRMASSEYSKAVITLEKLT